jgi:glycerol-3-phosphate dehydrogenase
MRWILQRKGDGRPFFIIPWNSNYLIGTTDAQFDADPDGVRTEQWEVDYLLLETNRLFPQANLSPSNILYTYSGVRPLPLTTEESEESITRRHFIKQHPRLINLVSIVGGKLTTYRSLAEECVDLVLQKLGKSPVPCRTADLTLPGAEDFNEFVSRFNDEMELSSKAGARLLNIYGSRAGDVVEFCRSARLLDYLDEEQTILAGEIGFSFEREFAQTLTDCLMRRTMIGLSSHLGLREAESAIRTAKDFKKWNEEERNGELERYLASTRRLSVS